MTGQRHPIRPSHVVSAPEYYRGPAPGKVTTWALSMPEGEPVGVLRWNDGGLSWWPADAENNGSQERAAELLGTCVASGLRAWPSRTC